MKGKISVLVLSCAFHSLWAFAQTVPVAQQASGQEGLRQMKEKEQKLRRRMELPVEAAPLAQQEGPAISAPGVPGPAILIGTILVHGNTVLSSARIRRIVAPFEGRTLTFAQMQKIADLVTIAYRSKGFVTSRAIIPPQKIQAHVLTIEIVEGRVGAIDVRGNRYFKQRTYVKRLGVRPGQVLNYNRLSGYLTALNQLPDRAAHITLTPGQEQAQTDLIVDTKDRLPIHAGFTYDNFASRYIGRSEYTGTLTDNNFLGFGDALVLQYQQTSSPKAYSLEDVRYSLPVTAATQIGIFAAHDQLTLDKEFKPLDARGKSRLYSVFVNHDLFVRPFLKLNTSVSFDYKDIYNFELGQMTSRDRLRVVKWNFDLDNTDAFAGRTIFDQELSAGIPGIMGGMKSVDPSSSRAGAGGRFTKDKINVLRLQRLPAGLLLFLKAEAQFAGDILPGPEQYQLGGAFNVRGFDPGEVSGDDGQSASVELSMPMYFMSKTWHVPGTSTPLYDALRTAVFFDAGHVHARNAQAGQPKNAALDSAGAGIRLNLPEDLFFKVDFAWGIKGRPQDHRGEHTWFEVSMQF